MLKKLLSGNRRFAQNAFLKDGRYYRAIARKQKPEILWIGCSDSRVSESIITDSKPGKIFVHRNIANIVAFNDINIASIVDYAVNHLKIPDIVICGHYNCGGIQALEDGVHENYIADWLLIASGAKEKVDKIAARKQLAREDKLNLLTEENIRLQVKHLKNLSLIKNRHRKGKTPRIHGWIYSMDTGLIKVLVDGMKT